MNRFLAFFAICIIANGLALPLAGQSVSYETEKLFAPNGELYFTTRLASEKQIRILSQVVSIDKVEGTTITANANKKEFAAFLELDLPYRALPHTNSGFFPVMNDNPDIQDIKAWDFYPTYEGYVSMMYQFQALYPQLCQVFSIGQSVQGRELLVARISDNVGVDEGEPEFFYTSTMHGDETTGYILLLRLIDYLLSNYGILPDVTSLVNNLEIYLNPLANPDGTYAGGNHTVSGAIRRNANLVDLNRNYPDPEAGPHPDGNPWQPETIAFMNFAESRHIVSSANIHGGAEVCNYPWDTWAHLPADDNWWVMACNEYADTAQYYSPPGYFDDFGTGVTNGYQWYTITGGRQDYMNYFHQCREFTLEISATKLLPAGQLNAFWGYNYRSLLNYMKQTRYGLQGIVTDSVTGQPIPAEVYVLNHEADSSWVYSSLPAGNYTRLLHQGAYNIKVSAPGYFPKTYNNVQIINAQATTLDVQLVPGTLIADFSANATSVPIGSTVDFTDQTYGNAISWEWTFEGGLPSNSFQQNPAGILYPTQGSFAVTLTVSDGNISHTIVKPGYITVSEEILMSNNTVTTCSAKFYDSGGQGGNYSNYEDYVLTIFPAAINGKICAHFTFFELEHHSNCNYDWLKIYNGANTSAPLIGTFCGVNSPGLVVATGNSGALTFSFHSDYSITKQGWEADIYCQAVPVTLDIKTYLEGPFEGNEMHNALALNPAFPLAQPYNTEPWQYAGTESVSAVPNNQVVDWVLLELRDASSLPEATPEQSAGRMACFILKNGSVVTADGITKPAFNILYYHGLYCAVWHRNHLGIISSVPLTKSGGLYPYDFSTGPQQVAGGVNGYRELASGIWGMAGGDGNADGQINNGDKIEIWSPSAGQEGYLPGDFTMDAQVNNGDKNEVWVPNTGLGCQVPE